MSRRQVGRSGYRALLRLLPAFTLPIIACTNLDDLKHYIPDNPLQSQAPSSTSCQGVKIEKAPTPYILNLTCQTLGVFDSEDLKVLYQITFNSTGEGMYYSYACAESYTSPNYATIIMKYPPICDDRKYVTPDDDYMMRVLGHEMGHVHDNRLDWESDRIGINREVYANNFLIGLWDKISDAITQARKPR